MKRYFLLVCFLAVVATAAIAQISRRGNLDSALNAIPGLRSDPVRRDQLRRLINDSFNLNAYRRSWDFEVRGSYLIAYEGGGGWTNTYFVDTTTIRIIPNKDLFVNTADTSLHRLIFQFLPVLDYFPDWRYANLDEQRVFIIEALANSDFALFLFRDENSLILAFDPWTDVALPYLLVQNYLSPIGRSIFNLDID
jgi:hypothetical protein